MIISTILYDNTMDVISVSYGVGVFDWEFDIGCYAMCVVVTPISSYPCILHLLCRIHGYFNCKCVSWTAMTSVSCSVSTSVETSHLLRLSPSMFIWQDLKIRQRFFIRWPQGGHFVLVLLVDVYCCSGDRINSWVVKFACSLALPRMHNVEAN